MANREEDESRVSWPIVGAAGLFAFLAARQLVRRVAPLLPGREADAGPFLFGVVFLLLVAWALLRRRRWAWWAGTLFASLGVWTSALALLAADTGALDRAFLGFPSRAGAAVLVGAASLAALVCLFLPSSRRAFRR